MKEYKNYGAWCMDELDRLNVRLDCLRIAVECGSQRDVMNPNALAENYYEWVMQGSEATRPGDSRKDDSPKSAKKARSVRNTGSTPQSSNVTV